MRLLSGDPKKSFFCFFEEHAVEIQRAAVILKHFFDGNINGREAAQKIKDSEHAADNITHEVVKQLKLSGFLPPIDHEDILAMIQTMDDVIDNIEKAVNRFAETYELNAATQEAKDLASAILELSELLARMCKLLRNASKNQQAIFEICVEIHRLENMSDTTKRNGVRNAASDCKNSKIDVVTFIAWHEIYGLLEDATDKAEDCANIAEQIVLKS